MTIGENLKRIRSERKLTQKALGELLHVSNKTISKWESNRSQPDVDTIKKIARLFDIDYKYLIDGDQRNQVELVSTQLKPLKHLWISSLYIFALFTGNYLFGKAYVIYDLHYIYIFLVIIISSITLLAICKTLEYKKSLLSILYLSFSSLNVFLLTTTIFSTEDIYIELIFGLVIYWLIISIISYYVFNKLKTKKSFIILFGIYLMMKLFIPFVVMFGIAMNSYGNI